MNRPTDPELQEEIAHLILTGRPDDTELTAPEHLALVRRATDAESVSRGLQQRAVAGARAAGVSWAALGAELGLSRQAVQQRFGARPGPPAEAAQERWLGPVTAFDEMAELELAGRMGWRSVGADVLLHRVVRTDTQWEHRRVVWTRPVHHYETDGWQLGCRAFPWLYLVRDLELAPENP